MNRKLFFCLIRSAHCRLRLHLIVIRVLTSSTLNSICQRLYRINASLARQHHLLIISLRRHLNSRAINLHANLTTDIVGSNIARLYNLLSSNNLLLTYLNGRHLALLLSVNWSLYYLANVTRALVSVLLPLIGRIYGRKRTMLHRSRRSRRRYHRRPRRRSRIEDRS